MANKKKIKQLRETLIDCTAEDLSIAMNIRFDIACEIIADFVIGPKRQRKNLKTLRIA